MAQDTHKPGNQAINVQDIRDAVNLGLPLLEMLGRHTSGKYIPIAVAVLRAVANNDEIAKAVEAAISSA